MNKLMALWQVLQQGQQVADPAFWKNKQVAISQLTILVIAIAGAAKAFGYDLGVTEAIALGVATIVVNLVNIVLTYATSQKVGLRPKPADDGSDDSTGV